MKAKTVILVIGDQTVGAGKVRGEYLRKNIFPHLPDAAIQNCPDLSQIGLKSFRNETFDYVIVLHAERLVVGGERLFKTILEKLAGDGKVVVIYEDIAQALNTPGWIFHLNRGYKGVERRIIVYTQGGHVTGMVQLSELAQHLV